MKKIWTIIKLPILIITISVISAYLLCDVRIAAASVIGFEAGNIIDDAVFTNYGSMTVDQIQTFLNSKVPVCDNWGTNGSTSTSRRDYVLSLGETLPLKCLKEYTENGKTAAQIIYDAAQEYKINPQVLIVLLQKEQGLITDDWPVSGQYRSATGYGCPDGAPCDSDYYGFTNQVRWSARMFRAILNDSPTWYTPYELGDNYIQYGVSTSCGGTIINIQNRATQALYNYTPYQPNQAALNAGYGSGDECSTYGNRNFYQYFKDWFNSVRAFVPLDTPRWMVIKNDTKKIILSSMEETGDLISAGRQIRFTTKAYINKKWYLRSEYDTINGLFTVICLDDVENINYTPLENSIYMQVEAYSIDKITPSTGNIAMSGLLDKGDILKISDMITVNGTDYYRTAYDALNNNDLGIPSSSLANIKPIDFTLPRYLEVKSNTKRYNINTLIPESNETPKGSVLFFNKKIKIDGNWYYISKDESGEENQLAFLSQDLTDVTAKNISNTGQKWMIINKDTSKYSMRTLENLSVNLTQGRQLKLADTFTINGKTFYRTEFDNKLNNLDAIPAEDLSDIDFISMDSPRQMILNKDSRKTNSVTGEMGPTIFAKGTIISFSTKITVNNITYLRTQFDTNDNNYWSFNISDLSNI